jgi:hypothetical protein
MMESVMDVKLMQIAESKVRQLGGDVCGVLVRTEGGVMAVSEHGRCTRLDVGVMGPVEQKLADTQARVAELERKNAKFASALKEKMIMTEGAYVLRKQAEAVVEFGYLYGPESTVRRNTQDYAQRLHQQADEADRAGGEE